MLINNLVSQLTVELKLISGKGEKLSLSQALLHAVGKCTEKRLVIHLFPISPPCSSMPLLSLIMTPMTSPN